MIKYSKSYLPKIWLIIFFAGFCVNTGKKISIYPRIALLAHTTQVNILSLYGKLVNCFSNNNLKNVHIRTSNNYTLI